MISSITSSLPILGFRRDIPWKDWVTGLALPPSPILRLVEPHDYFVANCRDFNSLPAESEIPDGRPEARGFANTAEIIPYIK